MKINVLQRWTLVFGAIALVITLMNAPRYNEIETHWKDLMSTKKVTKAKNVIYKIANIDPFKYWLPSRRSTNLPIEPVETGFRLIVVLLCTTLLFAVTSDLEKKVTKITKRTNIKVSERLK